MNEWCDRLMVLNVERPREKTRAERTMTQCPTTGDNRRENREGSESEGLERTEKTRGETELSTGEISTMHNPLRSLSTWPPHAASSTSSVTLQRHSNLERNCYSVFSGTHTVCMTNHSFIKLRQQPRAPTEYNGSETYVMILQTPVRKNTGYILSMSQKSSVHI